jgi:hypothetical protein
MPGLLDQMRAAEQAQQRGLLSHYPSNRPTINQVGRGMANALQGAGLLASPVPVLGDAMGLLGDAAMYAAKPEERTWGNAGMTLLGALPFVPSMAGKTTPAKKALEYAIEHRPMTDAGGAARLHDLATAFGDDIYDAKKALQYFGSGDARERSALRAMHAVRGKPDALVTIYRGVPEGASGINPGDWVTLDRSAAADYGKVLEMKVPASHITSWPDSLLEFGYYPPGK